MRYFRRDMSALSMDRKRSSARPSASYPKACRRFWVASHIEYLP
jgi:hypothetical protein